jgi:hypothetical protein
MRGALKRIGIFILAWVLGSTFAFIPALLLLPSSATREHISGAETAFILLGTWVFYRLEARTFRLPTPRGRMITVINIGWAVFAYSFVGGTIVAVIGHPSLAVGVVGLPAAIVLYVLLAERTKVQQQQETDTPTVVQ